MNNQVKGFLAVLAASLCWAIMGASSKYLFLNGVTPEEFVYLRVLLSSIILGFYLLVTNPSSFKLEMSDVWSLIFLSLIGTGLNYYFFFASIRDMDVGIAILIEQISPMIVAFYSVFFLKEKLQSNVAMALILSFGGMIFALKLNPLEISQYSVSGVSFAIGAAITFAYYSLKNKNIVTKYKPLTLVFYQQFFVLISMSFMTFSYEGVIKMQSFEVAFWAMFAAIMGTILPCFLFIWSLRHISATMATAIVTSEPIFAIVISALFLGEYITTMQIVGVALVSLSLLLLEMKQLPAFPRRKRVPSIVNLGIFLTFIGLSVGLFL